MAQKPENQNTASTTPVLSTFFVPDLCRVRAVFLILLISELLVLLLSLLTTSQGWIDWTRFGLTSLFVQWTVLTSAALICALRPWLQKMNTPSVVMLVTLLVLADVLFFTLLSHALLSQTRWPDTETIGRNLLSALIITLMVLRFFYLQYQWRRQKQAEVESRVTALQARIHPHFLFNSMNTIASLIGSHPERAEDAVLDLSELFRASLRTQHRLITLEEEIELCRRYLAIEKLRLGERLNVEWIQAPGLERQAIPPLTLQPLVENAIYHGIQPRPEGGTIELETQNRRDRVYLIISNPAPDKQQVSHQGNQMALINIRDRLSAIMGDEAVLKQSLHEGRYIVTVRLPRQDASETAT